MNTPVQSWSLLTDPVPSSRLAVEEFYRQQDQLFEGFPRVFQEREGSRTGFAAWRKDFDDLYNQSPDTTAAHALVIGSANMAYTQAKQSVVNSGVEQEQALSMGASVLAHHAREGDLSNPQHREETAVAMKNLAGHADYWGKYRVSELLEMTLADLEMRGGDVGVAVQALKKANVGMYSSGIVGGLLDVEKNPKLATALISEAGKALGSDEYVQSRTAEELATETARLVRRFPGQAELVTAADNLANEIATIAPLKAGASAVSRWIDNSARAIGYIAAATNTQATKDLFLESFARVTEIKPRAAQEILAEFAKDPEIVRSELPLTLAKAQDTFRQRVEKDPACLQPRPTKKALPGAAPS